MGDLARHSLDTPAFLRGDGEMVRRIREHDWAATALGPIEGWPQSLRSAVNIMLHSPGENGGEIVCHGSGGMIPRRAAR